MLDEHALALGVDIGGTHTKIALVTRQGNISHFRKIATEARGSNPQPYLANLLANIAQVLNAVDQPILGIGLAVHGHIDNQRRGQILCNNTPALRGLNLHNIIQERFNQTITINNDLTAHALAEYHFGSGKGARRFLCLAIGTGLGAGVIADGKPLRYIEGTSGDTGRLILDPNGPVDVYGVRGSAEILCGVPGIERLAQQYYGKPIPAHEVIQAARDGHDPLATQIIAQIGRYLGDTLALLSPIFLPNRIALTGGVTEAGAVLLNACRERFDHLLGTYHQTLAALAPDYYSEIDITLGQMRGETGVVGAVVEFFS